MFLTVWPNLWVHKSIYTHLAISPSKQNEQPGTLLKVLPARRISFITSLQGMSQKGSIVLQLSVLGLTYHTELPIHQAQVFSSSVN